MSSNNCSIDFGKGELSFEYYSILPEDGFTHHHVVILLLKLKSFSFNHRWCYDAVSLVFDEKQQTWTGPFTAVLTIPLNKPLRNKKGLIKSLARKLAKAFDKKLEEFYAEQCDLEWEEG